MARAVFNLSDYVEEIPVSDSDTGRVVQIPWTKISENSRNFYDCSNVEDLADSIAMNGLMDPLTVYPVGEAGMYRLLSGHRRLRAIKTLNTRPDFSPKFVTVPCMVTAPPKDDAREMLMLIQANSTGRVLSPREISRQAEELTKALTELKKQGVQLPGRMRDTVAAAMNMSSSKLARVKAIQNNLAVPGFQKAYQEGKMPEAVAYDLSQLDEGEQYKALDRMIDDGLTYDTLDMKAAQKIKREIANGDSTRQELVLEARKREIYQFDTAQPERLWRALLAETCVALNSRMLLGYSRGERVSALAKAYRLAGGSSGRVSWDGTPAGLRFTKPVRITVPWADVYEILLTELARHPAASAPERTRGDTQGPEWTSCGDPPEDGQHGCVIREMAGMLFADVFRYEDDEWVDTRTGDPATVNTGMMWYPVPAPPEEIGE